MSYELVCNFFGKQSSSETLFNDHNCDVHTQVESPCNLCDKSFRRKKKLRYHITSTHAEKEAFQCDIKSDGIQCIYYATTNSNLRAHKKRVHDEKPTNANLAKHVCGLCDFTTPSLTWTDIVRSAKLWIQVPILSQNGKSWNIALELVAH